VAAPLESFSGGEASSATGTLVVGIVSLAMVVIVRLGVRTAYLLREAMLKAKAPAFQQAGCMVYGMEGGHVAGGGCLAVLPNM